MRHDASVKNDQDTQSPVYGDRIRAFRERHGWTQTDLARHASVGLATVQRAERGDESLRRSTLSHLARALGVAIGDIYGVEDIAPPDVSAPFDVDDLIARIRAEVAPAVAPVLDEAPAWAVSMRDELMKKLDQIERRIPR